jgi:methyl-accepting chemotaxis protein
MRISNLNVGTRLSLGFGSVCLFLLIMVGVSGITEITLKDKIGFINNRIVPRLTALAEISDDVNAMALALRGMLLSSGQADRDLQRQAIDAAQKGLTRGMDQLESLTASARGTTFVRDIQAHQEKYDQQRDELLKLIEAGQSFEAVAYLNTTLRPTLAAYQKSIHEFRQQFAQEIQSTDDDLNTTFASTRLITLVLGGLAILLAAILGYVISRGLLRQLGGEPREAARIVGRVAAGDLTVDVVTKPGDTGSLLFAMKSMRESLATLVSEVRTGADAIASAAGQITTGNLDLSSRTEQQSASLAETAATMEELTSTVRQNSENAHQANGLAASAAQTVTGGGEVVTSLVATMGEINAKSQQVADIIGVIDSIAFQTNILALNAAVEAARAGEQGRGFAVVAAEVRALAQRSAASAKEIKALIEASAAAVAKGDEQAARAGDTMREILASIGRVTGIMGEISAAGREQTTGIEQINVAVTQMDDVTRQNASLVEESAAAAASLKEQADTLAAVVATFKLDGREGSPRLEAVSDVAPGRTLRPDARRVAAHPSGAVAGALRALGAPRRATAAESPEWAEF